jgi:hypothetical protein
MPDHLVVDCADGKRHRVSIQPDGEQALEIRNRRGQAVSVKLPTQADLDAGRAEEERRRQEARQWYIERLHLSKKQAEDLSGSELRREWICTVSAAQERINAYTTGDSSGDLMRDLAIVNASPPRL